MSASSHTESSYCQGGRPDVSQFIHLIRHSIGGTLKFMTISENVFFNSGIITVNRTGGTNFLYPIIEYSDVSGRDCFSFAIRPI